MAANRSLGRPADDDDDTAQSDQADTAERIELPEFADVMTAPPPRPVFALPADEYDMPEIAPDPPRAARRASPARPSARPRKPSAGRASGPTPAQIAALLTKACSGSSMLLVAWLELEDAYVMTRAEARAIADPASRMIAREAKRNTAFGRLCRWLMQSLSAAGDGHGDAIALLFALYAYGARVYPAASASLASRSPSRPLYPTAAPRLRPTPPGPSGGSHVRSAATPGPTQSRASHSVSNGASNGASDGDYGAGNGAVNLGVNFPAIAPGVTGYPAE